MSKPLRILVAGDSDGCLEVLFNRVRSVVKKSGMFEKLLCVGSFFGDGNESVKTYWKQLKDGEKEVPLPTYILGPVTANQVEFYDSNEDGGELCPNLTYLGRRGVFTLTNGLQIAYLSGVCRNSTDSKTDDGDRKISCHYSASDVDYLLSLATGKDYNGVDIFLSSEWPRNIWHYTTQPTGVDIETLGSDTVASIARALKPRYHFSALAKIFYERAPYRNHKILRESQTHVSRFLGLANVSNSDKKQKYLYAFNITPLNKMDRESLIVQPANTTECPLKSVQSDNRSQGATGSHGEEPAQQFFFNPKDVERGQKRPFENRGRGSPQVEKHLVVSVGDSCYMALPKGGLVPEHILILPIGHFPSTLELPEDVAAETETFKKCLRQYFHSKKKSCVIFERNFRSPHLQLQVVPVSGAVSDDIREEFKESAVNVGITFVELERDEPLSHIVAPKTPYFMIEFDSGPHLVHPIKGYFPLQFGRQVLASPNLLNVPGRIDWKSCQASKESETEMATSFRRMFQPYDFTREL
ncbi:CWF19-like protein 1 isoform X2 [Corticium candelabrum]|uniref:CWF19-like protein 1 isoform X2 n=1 Tax=Corticium candelabrum TaxID=121492 RepID=UPI002E263689|nr:CWF19-like protein 1 isoform X2 [Corticium candelabrum]